MRQQTVKEYCKNNGIHIEERETFPCQQEISNRLKLVINQALSKHSRITFFQVNLRFPTTCEVLSDNRYISEFMKRYVEKLEQQNLSPHYLWVRERKKGENQHYHVAIMLDGHKTLGAYEYISLAEDLWQQLLNEENNQFKLDDLVQDYNMEYASLMVYRNSKETLDNAFYWGSYLAKVRTKEKGLSYPNMGSTKLYIDC